MPAWAGTRWFEGVAGGLEVALTVLVSTSVMVTVAAMLLVVYQLDFTDGMGIQSRFWQQFSCPIRPDPTKQNLGGGLCAGYASAVSVS